MELRARRRFLTRQRKPYPRLIFKYRAATTPEDFRRIRSILIEHRLWLASRSSFNDPFDSRFAVTADGTAWHRFKKMHQLLRDNRPHLKGAALAREVARLQKSLTPEFLESVGDRAMGDMGICAFGRDARNLLMWSHYAESHSGIAIGFDVAVGYDPLAAVQDTEYSPEYITLNYLDDPRRYQGDLTKALLRKSSHWEYEQECRIIVPDDANTLLPIRDPACVRFVIYGCGIKDQARAAVQALLQERAIQGFPAVKELQAIRLPRRYGLMLKRWTPLLTRRPDGFY